ncbi:hypothetical protein A2154_05145 [Candidatus Gottesmanbacteria bacterium RBG_16_43_7]|uniref:Uncharacterized protein n=1 Tax=Candidatus Gottesmanbacteria bacterium RBG_16_43_7 TaxID=1798373 RepID=A0A1F5ZD04_9BACT|nr:MAG: hypothetical protein A2154_05145 [Candidatus Gottesmanbacteria bacterium RBG_16_43_7]
MSRLEQIDQAPSELPLQIAAAFESCYLLVTQNPAARSTGVTRRDSLTIHNYYLPGAALPNVELWRYYPSKRLHSVSFSTDTLDLIRYTPSTKLTVAGNEITQYHQTPQQTCCISVNGISPDYPLTMLQEIPVNKNADALFNTIVPEKGWPCVIFSAYWDQTGSIGKLELTNVFYAGGNEEEISCAYKLNESVWEPSDASVVTDLHDLGLEDIKIISLQSSPKSKQPDLIHVTFALRENTITRPQAVTVPNQTDIGYLIDQAACGKPLRLDIL